MSIRKRLILILLLLLLFVIIACVSMLYNTNQVIDDFKNVVSGSIDRNVDYGELLERYDVFNCKGFERADVEIRRTFVMHNFKRGIMNVNYTIYAYDKDGVVIYGSHNVPSTWHIEKTNGRWTVVKISEAP